MTWDFLDALRPDWSFDPLSDNATDEVILVDDDDLPIGTIDKLEAHRLGLCHRAISVSLRDHRNNLLLQQRSARKYHSPGLWSNTCCSHPRLGETSLDAARRRLREEMGIDCELAPLFTTHYRAVVSDELVENEIVHVFGGVFDGMSDPDPREVEGWCWMPAGHVAVDIDRRPDRYTVWFREYRRQFWPAIIA